MIEIVEVNEEVTKEQVLEAIDTIQRYCSQHRKCAECYLDNGAQCVVACPYLWKIVKEKGKENGSK